MISGIALLTVVLALAGSGEDSVDWSEVLGAPQGKLPAAREAVSWSGDLEAAMARARLEDRPVFVTVRCLPCKQCAEFDKDLLEGGAALDPLLRQFITVRLTSMRDVDLRLVPFAGFQDLDLSWWGYFLSPQGRTYGVYGGRDEVSDTTRISIPSLENVLRRVLAHHHDPRRESWDLDGPLPEAKVAPRTPVQLPGWSSWAARGAREANANECLHCHQVAEILRQPAIDAGTFQKQADFDDWPFPENVGLVLDRDHGLRVNEVHAASPAALAGLLPGDVLGAANGRLLFGQADLRGVLHRAERSATSLELVWRRSGEVHEGELRLAAGWRLSALGWRKSVAEAAVGSHPGFPWPLAVNADERRARGIAPDTLAVRPWFGPKGPKGPAAEAGLRGDDIIVAVNGSSPNVHARGFMVWFRLNHEPDQQVKLTVVNRAGERREVAYRTPPHTDEAPD